MKNIKVTSPSFDNGGWIPDCHSGNGQDESPELRIEGSDARTVSMVITLDDAGHPFIPNYNHWVAWNLPPVPVIPQNLPKGASVEKPIHMEQGLAYGKHCYRGPKPPFNWNHEYRFTVYTLDISLQISTNSNKEAVLKAMEGHVLQSGILIGKYQKKHK